MAVVFTATTEGPELRIRAEERRLLSRKVLPPSLWPSLSGSHQMAGRFGFAEVEMGRARIDNDDLLLAPDAVASATSSIAEALGMPPLARLSVNLSLESRIETADGRIRLRWRDRSYRDITPEYFGAVLTWGKERGRLGPELLALVDAVNGYNATVGAEPTLRIAAWAPVQAALRQAAGSDVQTDSILGSLTIFQAGAFALDVRERSPSEGPDFVPVLMAREKAVSLEDEAPADLFDDDSEQSAEARLRDAQADALLPPELQAQFLTQFSASGARRSHVLGRNQFVVVSPELKAALDVVRQKRTGSPEDRRAFLRNPRPALAAALGGEAADIAAALLFVETRQYSERVVGLGLWDPPKTPWIVKKSVDWLPERFPIRIGGRTLNFTLEKLDDLVVRVETARQASEPDMEVEGERVPLDHVERAISDIRGTTLEARPDQDAGELPDEKASQDRLVLQIKTNVEGVEYEIARPPRPAAIRHDMPLDLLVTRPKAHQREGFDWLVEAWAAGWPGVLLADDMGLGKTFQAMAFLAWIRANQKASRAAPSGPILVVAPTALLRNWLAEARLHLVADALGDCIEAFGPGLSRLKRRKGPDWSPEDALDVDLLKDAGWILTTYETLADNHRAFARVGYAVAVFDEMQKVKSPGTINTHAAKAINADFVLGLTGTPIENRLEDLWCLMDRIAPGYLGDLKSFSAVHSGEDPTALTALKARLDQRQDAAPAVMLRRMKEQILEGLPEKRIETYPIMMPAPQAEAYTAAVREAHAAARDPRAMLKAVHALRGISLHPDGAQDVDGYDPRQAQAWIERSARTQQVFELLRRIDRSGEKALVFIEDREVQRTFAAAAATLLGLARTPAIINGQVPGEKRQAIVDRFQKAPKGFDLLVLGPKSAGIGLTITAANHVLHLSRWWNPAVVDQCNDRVYRIGQTMPVTIHVPIATHPEFGDASFDVTLDRMLARKRRLSRDMLAPPVGDGDLREMFTATVGAEDNQEPADSD
jgi:hypothetical protein